MTISAETNSTGTGEAWVPRDDTFGARLALVRQHMRWNIKEAASECGVPAATWRLWELEGVEPRRYFETASAIAERVGCDLAWLMGGSRLQGRRVTERDSTRPGSYPANRSRPGGIRPVRVSGPLAA